MNSLGTFAAKATVVIGVLAGVAGIYSPIKEAIDPKPAPKLEIVMGTNDFSLPPALDEIFDQLKGDRKIALDADYALVAKYNPLNQITYAGLYNKGDRVATDIKINFPGAHILTVQEDGKELKIIQGRTDAVVEKLLPDGHVYFIAWGIASASSKNAGKVSAVYANGRIDVKASKEIYPKDKLILDKDDLIICVAFIIALFCLWYCGYVYFLNKQQNR